MKTTPCLTPQLALYHAGFAMPHSSNEAAMSLTVSATGVIFRPRSCTALLLLMWEASASLPSGRAAAAGHAALSVSEMNLADIEAGWLTMYLVSQHSRVWQDKHSRKEEFTACKMG